MEKGKFESPEQLRLSDSAGLTPEQSEEFDRKDRQGQESARLIRRRVTGENIANEPGEPEIYMEDGYEVAIPKRQIPRDLPTSKKSQGPWKPRSRRGLTGSQRLIADGPPEDYDGR